MCLCPWCQLEFIHSWTIQKFRRLERIVGLFPVAFYLIAGCLVLQYWTGTCRLNLCLLVRFNLDFSFHETKPAIQSLIAFKEFLVLHYEFMDKDRSLVFKVKREVIGEDLETYFGEKVVPLDQVVDVLVLLASFEHHWYHRLWRDQAVEAVEYLFDSLDVLPLPSDFLRQSLQLLEGDSWTLEVRVVTAHLAFHGLLPAMQIFGSFDLANRALLHLVIVLAAIKTQSEFLRQGIVTVREVEAFFYVPVVVVFVCAAQFTLKAELTPPILGDVSDLWVQAVRVERSLAVLTKVQVLLVCCLATYFATLTVQTLPALLVDTLGIIWDQSEAVGVETLGTQLASDEILLIAEWAT